MNSKQNDDKKELIREAAVQVFAEYGYYNTSISQVAEKAEVAVGTIYNYFKSKAEILEYIFAVELEKRISFLQQLKKKNISIWDKLKDFLEFHFSEVKGNIAAAKISIREKEFPRAAYSGEISRYRSLIPEEIEKLFDQAQERGEIKECKSEILSALIFGTVQGIVERAISENNLMILNKAPEEIITVLKEGLT